MTAARKLEPVLADDPVWAAACNAPPCAEPVPAEELAAFEAQIAEYKAGRVEMVPHADVEGMLERMRNAAE